jgi:mannosyltransferase OCH1-like enzyme
MKTILFLIVSLKLFSGIIYPDFTVSMMRYGNGAGKYQEIFTQQNVITDSQSFEVFRNVEIFRNIYAQNVLFAIQEKNKKHRIPRIVHQIWLGSPVPEKYAQWMRSWMNWNGWEYKLWTEEEVERIYLYNQDLYDESTNYGEKSDILRLEILLHHGGIYVDTDFECLNASIFDELNQSFDFYIGFEPLEHGMMNGLYKTCNAIIGSIPRHPLIRNLIVNLRSNWNNNRCRTAVEKSGPNYFSISILSYVLFKSGPENRSNYSFLRDIFLPSTFFYPLSEPEVRGAKNRDEVMNRIYPETAAIHYWSGSWFIPGGR